MTRCVLSMRASRPAVRFSHEAIDASVAYSWPANVVELENFVRNLIIGGEAVALSDLRGAQEKHEGLAERNYRIGRQRPRVERKTSRTAPERRAEIEEIRKALRERRWNQYAAARRLKISYRGLLYKIQHYRLRPSGRSSQFNLTLSILEMGYEA